MSLRRASPRPRRRAAGRLLRRMPHGARGALRHPYARSDESLRAVPRARGEDRRAARSSTPIDSRGQGQRAPSDEHARLLRRRSAPGHEPAPVPGPSGPGLGRRHAHGLASRLRDGAGRPRAPAARRQGADPQRGPAGGRRQDHRRLQSARHGDPETAREGGSGLRPGRRLRAVRLGQRRRVPGQHEVPDRLHQRVADSHPHLLQPLRPSRAPAAPALSPRRCESLLPLPARQQHPGAPQHLHRGEVHRDGAHLHQREGGLEGHALSGSVAAGPGEAGRRSRPVHLIRHGPGDRRQRGRPAAPRRGPRGPARRPRGRPDRERVRPSRPGNRHRRGRFGGGRIVRGRRARGEDGPAGPDPREGRLRRADRVPPARAAHDAPHLRHGVLGAPDLRPGDPHRLHRRGDRQAGGRLRDDQPRAGLRAAPARDP